MKGPHCLSRDFVSMLAVRLVMEKGHFFNNLGSLSDDARSWMKYGSDYLGERSTADLAFSLSADIIFCCCVFTVGKIKAAFYKPSTKVEVTFLKP